MEKLDVIKQVSVELKSRFSAQNYVGPTTCILCFDRIDT